MPKGEEADLSLDRLDELGFHELEIFLEFSRTEHLGATAESLGYSVSSIQRAVRVLEKRLGVALVQRDGRRVRLLHTGHVLADHAAHVIRARSEAVNAVLIAAGRRRSNLSIGHNFSMGLDVVPSLVAAVLKREPDTWIKLRSAGGTELVSSLLSGELDAAVISRPPAEAEIEVMPLYSEATKLIVCANDPLASVGHTDLSELRDRSFVALSDGTWSHQELLIACARAGFVPKVTVEASDMMALQGVVREGIAVAIIAERLARHGHPEIVALTIEGVAARNRTVSLAYPRKMRDTRAITALRAAAKAFSGRKR